MKTLFCIFLKIKNQNRGGAGDVTQWQNVCLTHTSPWVPASTLQKQQQQKPLRKEILACIVPQKGSKHHNDCEEASFHLGREGQLLVKYSLGCPGVSQVSVSSPPPATERRVVASWRDDLPFGHHEQLRRTGVALRSLFSQVREAGLNCQLLTTHTCEDACPTHLPQATLWKAGGFSRYR